MQYAPSSLFFSQGWGDFVPHIISLDKRDLLRHTDYSTNEAVCKKINKQENSILVKIKP